MDLHLALDLTRLVMLKYGIPDIRLLHSNNKFRIFKAILRELRYILEMEITKVVIPAAGLQPGFCLIAKLYHEKCYPC